MVQYKPSAQEILDRKSYGQGSRARFDPQWAMSRPTDWYQNRDNLSLVKDTLVRQPAVTTDQNESRNMYQMLMNQIRGGGGAQLLDTSGIPDGARRIGRTLFTDPAKSQGFLRDLGSLFTGKNKAAVRAPVHNVFGNFGQKGKDFYKKEFPIQSGLNTLMEKAGSMMPYASWLSKFLPKRKKEIIPRNPMFSPANNPWGLLEDGSDDEFNWLDAYAPFDGPFNAEQLRSEGKGGLFDLEDNIIPIATDSIERIISEDGNVEIDMDEASESIELPDDKKEELKALLLNPEFQALPWLEKLPILESYGYTEPDLLSGIN